MLPLHETTIEKHLKALRQSTLDYQGTASLTFDQNTQCQQLVRAIETVMQNAYFTLMACYDEYCQEQKALDSGTASDSPTS